MSESVLIAVIASSSALVGGIIGGLISMWTTKISADREDKRRREEIERKAATRRIENLYRPLLGLLNPRPPYDEYHIDREMQLLIFSALQVCMGVIPVCEVSGKLKLTSIVGVI